MHADMNLASLLTNSQRAFAFPFSTNDSGGSHGITKINSNTGSVSSMILHF